MEIGSAYWNYYKTSLNAKIIFFKFLILPTNDPILQILKISIISIFETNLIKNVKERRKEYNNVNLVSCHDCFYKNGMY
jgi:hypothetical protein